MAVTDYATLIAAIRVEANDTAGTSLSGAATSNFVMQDGPQGARDGVNTVFYLANRNIVTGTIAGYNYGPYMTYGTTVRSTTGFTLTDAATGVITKSVAPDSGTTQPFFFSYSFQWFLDPDYNTWIDQATEELNGTAGTALSAALYPALVQYALDRYWTRRASEYANRYATSAGGAAEQIQTVTDNFLKLAKVARAKGDKLRVNAYVDPGGKIQPASSTISTQLSRWSPRR